jgi:two-component system phosphate regulon response regulator OmpR
MKQILIIDDDETICTLLYQLFSENNFFAFYATDIDEANILISYIAMDCLLVDYMMPKQNGIEFLKNLKQNNIMIPSIMLTAIDDIDNKLTALEYASNDYLSKPFHSKELLLRVNNLIKKDVDIIYGNSSSIQIGELLFDMQNLSLKIHKRKNDDE